MESPDLFLECCQDCHQHAWYSHHPESAYLSACARLAKVASQRMPYKKIIKNQLPRYLKLLPSQKQHPQYLNLITRETQDCFPTLGAFEIVLENMLLYSKLQCEQLPTTLQLSKLFSFYEAVRARDSSMRVFQNCRILQLGKKYKSQWPSESVYSLMMKGDISAELRVLASKMFPDKPLIRPYLQFQKPERTEQITRIYQLKRSVQFQSQDLSVTKRNINTAEQERARENLTSIRSQTIIKRRNQSALSNLKERKTKSREQKHRKSEKKNTKQSQVELESGQSVKIIRTDPLRQHQMEAQNLGERFDKHKNQQQQCANNQLQFAKLIIKNNDNKSQQVQTREIAVNTTSQQIKNQQQESPHTLNLQKVLVDSQIQTAQWEPDPRTSTFQDKIYSHSTINRASKKLTDSAAIVMVTEPSTCPKTDVACRISVLSNQSNKSSKLARPSNMGPKVSFHGKRSFLNPKNKENESVAPVSDYKSLFTISRDFIKNSKMRASIKGFPRVLGATPLVSNQEQVLKEEQESEKQSQKKSVQQQQQQQQSICEEKEAQDKTKCLEQYIGQFQDLMPQETQLYRKVENIRQNCEEDRQKKTQKSPFSEQEKPLPGDEPFLIGQNLSDINCYVPPIIQVNAEMTSLDPGKRQKQVKERVSTKGQQSNHLPLDLPLQEMIERASELDCSQKQSNFSNDEDEDFIEMPDEQAFIVHKFCGYEEFAQKQHQYSPNPSEQFLDTQFSLNCPQSTRAFTTASLRKHYGSSRLKLFPSDPLKRVELTHDLETSIVYALNVLLSLNPLLITRNFQNPKKISLSGRYRIWICNPTTNLLSRVIIDDRFMFAKKQPLYRRPSPLGSSKSVVVWGMLLEKALAKMVGGYHQLWGLSVETIIKMIVGCPVNSADILHQESKCMKMLCPRTYRDPNNLLFARDSHGQYRAITGCTHDSDGRVKSLQLQSFSEPLSWSELKSQFVKISISQIYISHYYSQKQLVASNPDSRKFGLLVKVSSGAEIVSGDKPSQVFLTFTHHVTSKTKVEIYVETSSNRFESQGQISRTGSFYFQTNFHLGKYLIVLEGTNPLHGSTVTFYSLNKISVLESTALEQNQQSFDGVNGLTFKKVAQPPAENLSYSKCESAGSKSKKNFSRLYNLANITKSRFAEDMCEGG